MRELASARHLNLGSCAAANLLMQNADDGKYAEALVTQVNLIEPENDLKPPALWRGVNDYDFTNSDYLIGWAREHKLNVRGHVLVYARDDGYTIPRWLLNREKEITPDQAKQMLHDYIFAVAGRYRRKIKMWDVANEAIEDGPSDRPYHLRNSFWFRKLGPEFLVLAFQFAHEADPKAELYYNEYGVEGGGTKAKAMLELVDFLKRSKAPITGVGLQYHTWREDHVAPGDGHYQLLDAIRSRKLAFMVTELDLGIKTKAGAPADPADLDHQAENYANIFKMALSYPNCHGVQMWGITDRHSWISQFQVGKGCALLLDSEYRPKPAYEAVRAVLASR